MKATGPSEALRSRQRNFGRAWIALGLIFLLHIADEAATDVLAVYNPWAEAMQQRFPLFPLPPMSYTTWFILLGSIAGAGLALTPLAFQGRRVARKLAYLFAAILFSNGVMHVALAAAAGRAVSGVYTSPLLLIGSAILWRRARALRNTHG